MTKPFENQKIKKRKFQRYFSYFLLGLALLLLLVQIAITNFKNGWNFDTILPLAVLFAIVLALLGHIVYNKRMRSRRKALKKLRKMSNSKVSAESSFK
jgi:uncharacterized integral membrane protein